MTGDEPQGTMRRVQTAGEATSRPLSPSRLLFCAHVLKRDVWVRGRYLANVLKTNLTKFAVILSEKASKCAFLKPEKLQNHSNEGKGKEKKKERGERKEEKRKQQWLHS